MKDYQPLDLSSFCNAGPSVLGKDHQPAIGKQLFHGLPFQIGRGRSPRQCFIAFGRRPLRPVPLLIPIGKHARRLIFAHAMLETRLSEGGPVGLLVARYDVLLADGRRLELPIRERLEIGIAPLGMWGQWPITALPDQKDSLQARYQGQWGGSGYRQCEAQQGVPRDYTLWDWENPLPDVAIERLEILPEAGQRFFIAGITLSHVEEPPFYRNAAVPVQLTMRQATDAAPPFSLELVVDRGVATYPYALPEQSARAFVADAQKGWGEKQNPGNSPAYTEIAAIPSATVTVVRNRRPIARVQWGKLEQRKRVDTPRVRFEVVTGGRNWVHTTVVDDETDRPIPCRVHFRSPRGIPYAPHGHHAHVNSNLGTWHIDVGGDVRLGQISYAYIDGSCQGWLPRGPVIVDVARGYEYEPLRTTVEIQPAQRELRLRLKRRHHLNAERYFSGDTHVHFLSSQGALLEAAAEDLDVVNLLQSQWGHLFTSTEEFIGRPLVSPDGGTVVYASQENRQHILGHLSLLGLKKPVMPWCSGGPSEAELGGNVETTLSHWADACHAQGGTVVIPHLPNPNAEPAALIATGRADAVEMIAFGQYNHLEYYRYLNGGYRLPLAGGTDKMDSGVPVGLYRTYAYIPPDEPFTYDNWCKALRGGNTFVSGGPLLRLSVDGQPIGRTICLGRDGGTVEVEANASSIFPINCLEIVQGGKVVASTQEKKGAGDLRLRATVKVTGPTWLCARCGGPGYVPRPHHDTWTRGIFAHTSPVYLACGETYDLFSADTAHYMLTLLHGSLEYLQHRAPQWPPDSVTHHHGEADHQAFLERPFHEAIAALHRQFHDHGVPH